MIRQATKDDLDQVRKLYVNIVDFMKNKYSYFTWDNNIYPTTETAIDGISKNEMYVYVVDNKVAGTVIINEDEPTQYKNANFNQKNTKNLIVHTLAVSPDFLRQGIAKKLLNFIDDYAFKFNYDAIRLDTYSKNEYAIKLYEACGYNFVGLVDLELGLDGLFKCYEKEVVI